MEMQKLRYFTKSSKSTALVPAKAVHTNFLRTGRIARRQEEWLEEEKRYLTYEEVAERTGARLETAGKTTHERLNSFHHEIKFPEIIFHRTLATAPHLGYVHVTAAKTSFADFKNVSWGFYIANFVASVGGEDGFFKSVDPRTKNGRMYFAVAMKKEKDEEAGTERLQVNRDVRGNGLLFCTSDPTSAFKSVLMMGAKDDAMRKIVSAIGTKAAPQSLS